jgi:hypothetical protein
MSTQIVLNSNNYDSDTGRFSIQFPIQQHFQNKKIAAANINIYNSFDNISSALGNNQMTLYFPSASNFLSASVTIQNGFYTLSTFESYMKAVCDENYMYILLSDGVTKQYFFTTAANASYQNLILFYQVPPGVSPPANASRTTPTVGTTPCMYFEWPASLGKLFGYTSLQFGSGINKLYTSGAVSQIHNVSSIVFLCNLIKTPVHHIQVVF